jgi:hypothetical protein
MRARAAFLLAATAIVAGCHDPLTQVVVVFTSDLVVPNDVDSAGVAASSGVDPPGQFSLFTTTISPFPLSIGVEGEQSPVFSLSVLLTRFDLTTGTQLPVVTRNATGVRFVPQQTRMLVISLPAACACHGTTCPLPGTNPDCDTLENPETVPFDPEVAPPSNALSQPGGGILVRPPTKTAPP